ncbi:Ig-like domain-containing protein [Paenibacillus agaridevorans]|uniref:Ig-like domain-containing protein n=1 Tax=Paenibacillus agaridevorans TaxID=171404 RepID=UPI001BE4B67A|nr:Ig-like domain-containing protein [Paenibacillus agaridevorans]
MKIRTWKPIIACVLAVMMVLSLVTPTITAAGVSTTSTTSASSEALQQSELYAALVEEYGEDEALTMLRLMQQLGTVNDQGEVKNFPIVLNGQSYSLDQAVKLIQDPNTDLSQIAAVDGDEITLEQLKKLIEIEQSLGQLLDKLEQGEVDITEQHLNNIEDIYSQAFKNGIQTLDANGNPIVYDAEGNMIALDNQDSRMLNSSQAGTTPAYIGKNEDYKDLVQISVHLLDAFYQGDNIEFRLNTAQSVPVSFKYEWINVSQKFGRADGASNGTITFKPGETSVRLKYNITRRGQASVKTKDWNLFQNDVFDGYSQADLLHFYDFKNFDRFSYKTSLSHSDLGTYYSYNGGAYVPLALRYGDAGRLEIGGVRGVDEFNIYAQTNFSGKYLGNYLDRFEGNSATYKTGQLLPINVYFNHPQEPRPPRDVFNYKNAKDGNLDLKNGQIAYLLSKSREPDEYDYVTAGLLHSFASPISKQATIDYLADPKLYDGFNVKKVNNMNRIFNWKYWRDVDFYGNNYPNPNIQHSYPEEYAGGSYANNPEITIVPNRADIFNGLSIDKNLYYVGDNIKVEVQLEATEGFYEWLVNGAITPEDIKKRVYVSVGDRDNGIIELDWKRDAGGEPTTPLTLTGELEVNDKTFDLLSDAHAESGYLRAKIFYNNGSDLNSATLGLREDMAMLNDTFQYFKIERPLYITADNASIVYPDVWPSGTNNEVNLISGNATKLSYQVPAEATFQTPDQLEWRSSDESIASILADGTIIPKTTGFVTFSLIAKNDGRVNPPTEIVSDSIEIIDDGSAMIVIPSFANQIIAYQEQDAVMYWSTNVMSRYKKLAQGGTPNKANFKVELYEGNYSEADLAAQTPIQTWSGPATTALVDASSFVIPGQYLTALSIGGAPTYTLRVSTKNPENELNTLAATSHIVVRSPAVKIEIDRSAGQAFTDSVGSIPISWNMSNFDGFEGSEFEFEVTRNGERVLGSQITYDAETEQFTSGSVNKSSGDFVLKIDAVDGSSQRLKDNYVVTIKAKNSSGSTWSYDSYYLYVYDADSLEIWVDGQQENAVKLSNIDRISTMTSEQILALKRDITLVKGTNINYSQFKDLNLITDQVAWDVADYGIATLNYGTYNNVASIEEYEYNSYTPTSKFHLTGLETGQTKVNATHARTGIAMELDVTVETLRDKLYLFQLYPKVESTLSYKTIENGVEVEREVKTNATGELALYEENGIVSDVYITSFHDHSTYTGVIDGMVLKSKEQDPATRQLYPVNILQLRRLAEVDVYLKKPDGKPYVGEITYRGGVYRNGRYASPAEIGVDTPVTIGNDGRLHVIFDTTDFYDPSHENNAYSISAKDEIEIILEVQFGNDAYYPLLVYSSGNATPVDMIEFGDKNQGLRANPSGQRETFIYSQFVNTSSQSTRINLLNYRGKFGPNNQFSSINLTTEFMWWGETNVNDTVKVELLNELGVMPDGQSYETMKYPFSDYYTTKHVQLFNSKTIWLEKAKSGSYSHRLYDDQGEFLKSFNGEATVVNMIGVPGVDIMGVSSEINRIRNDMKNAPMTSVAPSNNDKIMLETLKLLGKYGLKVGPASMNIYPTDDPMVYKTIMKVHKSTIPSTTGGSGADVKFFKNNEQSFAPGAGDMLSMAKGSYAQEQRDSYNQAERMQGQTDKGPMFTVGGYYMGTIRYNTQTGQWDNIVEAGGFTAGGGFQYKQSWNMMAGFVPVTFSIEVGAAIEIGFNTSVLYDEIPGYPWSDPSKTSENDYLASLRVVAYAEVFGGVGFDLSIIAMKIGVFGRLTFDNTTHYLSRNYAPQFDDKSRIGNKLTLEGIVGVRVMFKFLFISVTHDLASLKYSKTWLFANWNEIEEYWKKHSKQGQLTSANAPKAISMYLESIGQPEMEVLEGIKVENRDYLTEYERAWKSSGTSNARLRGALSTSATSSITTLQTNAYPFSNPIVANDGSLFAYLSDAGSTDVKDTVASWAKLNTASGQYEDQGSIVTDSSLRGFGDSGLQVDGEDDFVAAVWVTQDQPIAKEAGEEITNEEIMLMNNSTEVVAAIYDGQSWVTYPLTDNATPDLAPVVAVSDDKVMVAYRNAYSHNVDNPFDFSSFDSIMYRVYDRTTGEWSDPEVLYNGTNGTIMGINAAALSDGTSAIAFAVNHGGQQDAKDNEIVYMVVDTNKDPSATAATWKTKGIVKHVQLTSDQWADENPQLTSVRWSDNSERFVLAWYKTSETAFGSKVNDIPLAAIDKSGELDPTFVDSLSDIQVSMDEVIDPRFVFAKMSDTVNTVDNLSIVWKNAKVETDETTGESIQRDSLRAVKFGVNGSQFYLSSVQDIGTAEDFTQLDSLSVYVSAADGRQVKGVLLGTTYTTDALEAGNISTEDGEDIPVYVSKTISNLYTSTGYYKNAFNGGQIYLNPEEIVRNFDLPIEFTIVNEGIDTIDEVTIEINGRSQTYPVQIAPNRTEHLVFTYSVPDSIGNIDFTVTARFANGEHLTEDGRIKLDIADIGMSDASMTAADGIRELTIPLYNKNDATLAGNKGRVVKVGLYENTNFIDEFAIGTPLTIADELSLDMMDNGGYTAVLDFDVKSYLAKQGKTEIPDEGLYVYVRTWLEDENGAVLTEFDDTNNFQSVFVERLSIKYNKPLVRMETEQNNTGSGSVVSFSIQNMNMAPIADGNVVMFLLDENGEVLEKQYLTHASQLLQLGSEQIVEHIFSFTQKGHDVRAEFYQESTNNYTSDLSLISMTGIPLNFEANSGTREYRAAVEGLDATQLIAAAKNPGATVTVLGPDGQVINNQLGGLTGSFALNSSANGTDNEFTITVTPKEKGTGYPSSTTYKVIVNNTSSDAEKLTATVTSTNPIEANVFWDDATIHVSKYDVPGFKITKVQYNINSQGWIDSANAYDGTQTSEVVQLTTPDQYDVRVRVVLDNGKTLDAGRFKFSIEDPAMDPVKSTIEANAFESLADGTTPVKLNIILRNANGYLLEGRTVELTNIAGVATTNTAVQSVTDAQGTALFDVTSAVSGTATIEAKEAGGNALAVTKDVSFKIGGPSASRTTIEVESGAYADGVDEAELVITVRDAGGHELENVPYQLWMESGTGSISPGYLTGNTDASGKITAKFTSKQAGTPFRFVARIGNSTYFDQRFNVTFIAGPVDGSKMNIELAGFNANTDVIANGTDSRTVRVTLIDAASRPIANKEISLTTDKTGVTISPETRTTNSNGEAYFTVTGTEIGEAVVTATEVEQGFSKTLTLNFVAGSMDGNQTEATISKTTLVAGSTETATITAYVRDAKGYPITNKTVNLQTRNGLNNGLIGTEAQTTDSDGKVEFIVPARAYGSVTLQLYMENVPYPFKTFMLMNDYGPADESNTTVTLDKTEIKNDGSDAAILTVRLADELNQAIANKSVKISTESGHIRFSLTSSYTNSFGSVNFGVYGVSLGTADIKITVDGSDAEFTATVNVVPVDFTYTNIRATATLDKTTVLGNGVDQAVLTIEAKDRYGNPYVSADIDASMVGPATVIPITGKTDADGKLVIPIAYQGASEFTTSGNIRYNGAWTSLPSIPKLTFVQGEVDGINSEISVEKVNFKIGETPKLTMVIKAENGEPYQQKPNERYVFEVTGTLGDGKESFTKQFDVKPIWGNPYEPYLLDIRTLGKAELSVNLVETNSGTRTKLMVLPTLTFTRGDFIGNGYLTSPVNDSAVSLEKEYWVNLTATTTDSGGNPIAGRDISLIASVWDPDSGSYIPDTKTVFERTGDALTNAAGITTFRMKRTEPGSVRIEMYDEGLKRVVGYGHYHTFTSQVFDPEQSRIEVDHVERIADGSEASLITVHMVGTDGKPMVGAYLDHYGFGIHDVQVDKLDAQDGSDANGVYRFRVTSQQPANVVMYFADSYRQIVTMDSVVLRFINPDQKLDVEQSRVEAIKAAVAANGQEYGVIEVEVVDHNGTPIPYREVKLEPLSGSSHIDVEVIETDGNGKAMFMVSNQDIDEITYKVIDMISGQEFTQQATLMFVAGNLDVSASSVTSSHSELLANGTDKAVIEATLLDSSRHPLASRQVRLEAAGGQSAIAPQLAVTDENGVASFEVAHDAVESITYAVIDVATEMKLHDQIVINYVTGAPDAQQSVVSAHRDVVVADGTSATTITVTVKDLYGHAINGAEVRLAASGGSSTITNLNPVTGTDGKATFEVTSGGLGEITYTAYAKPAGGTEVEIVQKASVTFVNSDMDVLLSSVAAAPTSVVADGVSTVVVTATIVDKNGLPVTNRELSLHVDDSTDTRTWQATTNEDGIATFELRSSEVESLDVYVKDVPTGLTLNQQAQISFVAGPVDTGSSTIAVAPASVHANGQSPAVITVTIKDAYQHVLAGETVSLWLNGAEAEQSMTDAQGHASFTVTGHVVEQRGYEVYVAVNGEDESLGEAIVSFVNGSMDVIASSITTDAQSPVKADGTSTATITVKAIDEYGHVMANREIELIEQITNRTWRVVTDGNGEAAFAVSATDLGQRTYRAYDVVGSAEIQGSVSITYIAGATPPVDPSPVEPTTPTPEPSEPNENDEGLFNSDILDLEKMIARFREQLEATKGQTGTEGYGDIAGHWAMKPIGLFSRLEGIRGYQDGTVRGNATMTRAEFSSMLVQLLEIEKTGKKKWSLSDIQSHWAAGAIATLAGHGVINGYADGTFRPDQTISRQEMVTMLLKLVNEEALPNKHVRAFADVGNVSPFAVNSVQAAGKAGIIQGYEDGTFRPQNHMRRAEAVVMLLNLLMVEERLHELFDPELKK